MTANCGYAGGIAGSNDGWIENCTSYVTLVATEHCMRSSFGGITAHSYAGTVKNCTDESTFYIFCPSGDPDRVEYVKDCAAYNKVLENDWHADSILNYTDHSRNMGVAEPTVWNVHEAAIEGDAAPGAGTHRRTE